MTEISVVLFDLGGTLIYFDCSFAEAIPESDRAMIQFLRSAGYNLAEDFSSRLTARVDEFLNAKSPDFLEKTTEYFLNTLLVEDGFPAIPPDMLEKVLSAKFDLTQPCWKLEQEAVSTLELLKEQGFRLGLVSNAGYAQDVDALIDRHGLRPYFDLVIISAREGIRKPNPAIFRMALDFFKVAPGQAIMVGDTLGADILGAQNAGISSVFITRRAARLDNQVHQDTIQPDAAIENLSELPDLIQKMSSDGFQGR